MERERYCEVAVVGAGPAGCAASIALAGLGIQDVVLIDAAARPERNVGETLSPGARRVLQKLQLWDDFLEERHEPCFGNCSSWGVPTLGYSDFVLGADGPAWHLDRPRFLRFLLAHARASARYIPARVSGASGDKPTRLNLRSVEGYETTLDAHFIIDASGASSIIAKRMGARRFIIDKLTFTYAFFQDLGCVERSRLTMVEAVPDGWWYTANLPRQQTIVTFASEGKAAASVLNGDRGRWFEMLLATNHVAERLRGCIPMRSPIRAMVVAPSFLDRYSGSGWAAAGDAANVYDPLSSQGIETAIADGVAVAEEISAAIAGRGAISEKYGQRLAAAFHNYRITRDYFYRSEGRWSNAPFWQSRWKHCL